MKQFLLKIGSIFILFLLCTSSSTTTTDLNSKPYVPGEKLVFLAHFGWINAGEGTFTVRDSIFENKKLLHAVAKAKTTGIADLIFEVNDVYESFFNPNNYQSFLAIRNLSEGGYIFYNEVRYDYNNKLVTSTLSGEHNVPENILDILTAFYYFRDLIDKQIKNPGDELIINTYYADEIFSLKVIYNGDERIKTKLGKFEAMKFLPVVEAGRIFDSEDDVTIWISKDENHVPLQVRIELIIGSIKCDLVEFSGLKHELKFSN